MKRHTGTVEEKRVGRPKGAGITFDDPNRIPADDHDWYELRRVRPSDHPDPRKRVTHQASYLRHNYTAFDFTFEECADTPGDFLVLGRRKS